MSEEGKHVGWTGYSSEEKSERQYDDARPAHFIIKWNPCKERPEKWLAYAEEHAELEEPWPGKRVALFEVFDTRTPATNIGSLMRRVETPRKHSARGARRRKV